MPVAPIFPFSSTDLYQIWEAIVNPAPGTGLATELKQQEQIDQLIDFSGDLFAIDAGVSVFKRPNYTSVFKDASDSVFLTGLQDSVFRDNSGVSWLDYISQNAQQIKVLQEAQNNRELVISSRQFFSAAITGLAVAALPTDIFAISGGASNDIYVTRITLSGSRTSAASANIDILLRSTLNTGGTSTAPAAISRRLTDTSDATVLAYTANPTTGTLVGLIDARRGILTSGALVSSPFVYDFTDAPQKLGATDLLAINLEGTAMLGSNLAIYIEWYELIR